MSFPFPLNPVDGQVVSQTQSDGTVLTATYVQAKNDWVITRVRPNDPSITLISGIPYTVPPAWANGQVLTWDNTVKQWRPAAPKTPPGSGTYAKGKLTDADTPNPPDPAEPKITLKPGMLQSTLENLHKEVKAWDGTAWVKVLTEDDIKQWIAAGSLFQSVIKEAGINTLPAPAATNKGFYWTWAGTSNYIVKATDIPLAPGLTGEVVNPGDWLQSDGTKYVHVSGDLLSKQRWLSLGGFTPWSDTSWESGSIVSYNKSFFRAKVGIVAGDAPPGDGSAGNKWQDITPIPHMGLEDLRDVNANVKFPAHGEVFQWDDNIGEWVASDVLTIGAIKFDDTGNQPEVNAFTGAIDQVDPAEEGSTVPTVQAIKDYVTDYVKDNTPLLEELEDCKELAKATDKELPMWNSATSQWEPTQLSLADLKKVNANTLDPDLHGAVFQWDENIDEWVASDSLLIGSIKFDDTGIQPEVTAFTDAIDLVDPAEVDSTVPTVQAVKDYVKDFAKDNLPYLDELEDCKELATSDDGQVPVWNGANNRWEPKFLTSPIIFLGNGAWDATLVADRTQNYGMPAGTNPNPQVWMPQPGDQYINMADGHITLFS